MLEVFHVIDGPLQNTGKVIVAEIQIFHSCFGKVFNRDYTFKLIIGQNDGFEAGHLGNS